MADPLPYSDSGDETGVEPERGSSMSTPRWVKVFGLITIVVVLLVVIVMVADGGSHGPGRHTPSGDAVGRPPPSSVTAGQPQSAGDLGGHTPPEGDHR
ncbi:MAG: hypothetical protein GEU83_10870 [Pseudonocardiaceae bacterium]|nr:hypothetical protein [Pseudonocardiaceae bacterium]